jgi:WD40 repeat protein
MNKQPSASDFGNSSSLPKVVVLTPGLVAGALALLVGVIVWMMPLDAAPEPGVIGRHSGGVRDLAFSPDGKSVVSSSNDGAVTLWDLPGIRRWAIYNRGDFIGNLIFSPDGANVAACCAVNGTVILWDVALGGERTTVAAGRDSVRAVAFSPDGSTLACGGLNGRIGIWDLPQARLRVTLGETTASMNTLAFFPDGNSLAAGHVDGNIAIWDVGQRRRKTLFRTRRAAGVSVAFARDGSYVATTEDSDYRVHVWDMSTGSHIWALRHPGGRAAAVAFSADGKILASGGCHGTIMLWDTSRGSKVVTLRGHHGIVVALAFSADGGWLASGGDDGTVRLWDLTTIPSKPAVK